MGTCTSRKCDQPVALNAQSPSPDIRKSPTSKEKRQTPKRVRFTRGGSESKAPDNMGRDYKHRCPKYQDSRSPRVRIQFGGKVILRNLLLQDVEGRNLIPSLSLGVFIVETLRPFGTLVDKYSSGEMLLVNDYPSRIGIEAFSARPKLVGSILWTLSPHT